MDYRVSASDPQPPARGVALIGGLSALALAVSPFLVWWSDLLGTITHFSKDAGVHYTFEPILYPHYSGEDAFSRLILLFGLISLPLWVRYGLSATRWMRPLRSRLVMLAYLACSIAVSARNSFMVLTADRLDPLHPRFEIVIGPGLYLALGASVVHTACLAWLLHERLD